VDQKEQARRSDAELIAVSDWGTTRADFFAHRAAGGNMRSLHRQRGWLGLIGLLLALVIVAVLAQKVLKTYGLLPGAGPGAGSASERGLRGPGVAIPAPYDGTGVTPTPAAAMERARGLESAVQQQAQDMNKRIDEGTK
jgi:hypothetical protein